MNTVLSLIQALGVYFSIPLIDWASNRAWASIRGMGFYWGMGVYFSIPLLEWASNGAWASIRDGLLLETLRCLIIGAKIYNSKYF
uniref:Uncharacterized protein n=1 Tax=Meloidogyne incognita TaxID=6306 RepID=A0A914N9C6_MELIC